MLEMLGIGVSTVLHFIMDNIVIINIILSLIIVFFERRSPQAVWTWLLLLYFIPIVGFILYLGHWSGFPQEQDVQGKGD